MYRPSHTSLITVGLIGLLGFLVPLFLGLASMPMVLTQAVITLNFTDFQWLVVLAIGGFVFSLVNIGAFYYLLGRRQQTRLDG